jgi:hypothetical protein
LKAVKIESAMMLSPPLINRTTHILGCNPHISDLSLDSVRSPYEKWVSVLFSITLPCLRKFSITILRCKDDLHQQDTVRAIVDFVSRHSTITEFRCSNPLNPTSVDKPSDMLPALESLNAQPNYVAYLLQMPNALPSLRRVTIDLPLPYKNFASLSRALAHIGQRSTDLTLCIEIPSVHMGLFTWFASGVGEAPAARVERSLHCVKRLEFHVHLATHASQLVNAAHRQSFLAWLSLFPDLRFFEIDKGSLSYMSKKALGSFVKVLSGHCPKLELVKLEGEERDIPSWLALAMQSEQ